MLILYPYWLDININRILRKKGSIHQLIILLILNAIVTVGIQLIDIGHIFAMAKTCYVAYGLRSSHHHEWDSLQVHIFQ